MALGFLTDIAGTVEELSGPVGQIVGAIRGPRDVPQVEPLAAPPAETEAMRLLAALADPGNERIAQLRQEEFQQLAQALSQGIRGQVLADRRERSLGRAGAFFDPERQDEALSLQLSRGLPALQQQAQSNVLDRILAAVQQGNFAPGQQQRILGDTAARGARQQEIASREQESGGAFGRFERGLGGLTQILEALNRPSRTPPTSEDLLDFPSRQFTQVY